MDLLLGSILHHSLGDALRGAALVDRSGRVIAVAGTIVEEEAMPLAALVMFRLKSGDLAARLFAGEVICLALDDRDVAVAVAKRQLFLVAALDDSAPATLDRVRDLRVRIAAMLAESTMQLVPPGNRDGGSGSGPAEMPVIEFGVTVGRERGGCLSRPSRSRN